eukprot:5670707-Amphidinium_carterae.1
MQRTPFKIFCQRKGSWPAWLRRRRCKSLTFRSSQDHGTCVPAGLWGDGERCSTGVWQSIHRCHVGKTCTCQMIHPWTPRRWYFHRGARERRLRSLSLRQMAAQPWREKFAVALSGVEVWQDWRRACHVSTALEVGKDGRACGQTRRGRSCMSQCVASVNATTFGSLKKQWEICLLLWCCQHIF